MLVFRLAFKNLTGSKLRTGLNVGVLSFIYVLVIWHQGLFDGMYSQSSRFIVDEEIGGGQYWHAKYDPYDPLTIEDSHGPIPLTLQDLIQEGKASPILIRQASISTRGRIQSVIIRGIDPEQSVLKISTPGLDEDDKDYLPIMVGTIMAKKNKFKIGDFVTIRWRDVNGTYDAIDGKVTEIMKTHVPMIDKGYLWVSLNKLQEMYGLKNEASIVVMKQGRKDSYNIAEWNFKDQEYLLNDITASLKSKKNGAFLIYIILLSLALIAIFDTQMLSIFRRKKEIGTLMAMGMVRSRVIVLFTIEGAMNSILGMIIGAVYGIPILVFTYLKGIPMPKDFEATGFSATSRLHGEYSFMLILSTLFIITLIVTVVSYLPARKITGLKPAETLKGNIV